MKTYRGERLQDGTVRVTVHEPGLRMATVADLQVARLGMIPEYGDPRSLPLRLDLANHSPTGFEWGFGGSGPVQLALALAADALGDDARALAVHQALKRALVETMPRHAWRITDRDVRAIVVEIEGRAPPSPAPLPEGM